MLDLKGLPGSNMNCSIYFFYSLNREKRQRELLRVTRENQEILKRIMAREPEYDHRKWEQEWEENQAFMDSIAQYPRDWWKEEKVRLIYLLDLHIKTEEKHKFGQIYFYPSSKPFSK